MASLPHPSRTLNTLTQRTEKYEAAARLILNAIEDPTPFRTSDMALTETPKEMTSAAAPVQLRDYQLEGVGRAMQLEDRYHGFILGDEPGLGKTFAVIALILSKPAELPTLVAVPAGLIANWSLDLERFFPSDEICLLEHRTNGMLSEKLETYKVILASYEIIGREFQDLKRWLAGTVDREDDVDIRKGGPVSNFDDLKKRRTGSTPTVH